MADKYLYLNSGVPTEKSAITTSAGAGDSGKIPGLDSAGKLDNSFMPTGIGADTASIAATENLSAGDLVNIYNSSGAKCRKADASTAGKQAHGFVLAAVTSGQNATVYFEGTITGLSGVTPGDQYLSASTAGGFTATAPSSSGNVVQYIGVGTSTTTINAEFRTPYVLA